MLARSDAGIERLAIDQRHAHLGRLPLHRRGQQPVAVAEPFVERLLRAAGPPRHRRHGQPVARLDQQIERRRQHRLLAWRKRVRSWPDRDGHLTLAPQRVGRARRHARAPHSFATTVPYVTVRRQDARARPLRARGPFALDVAHGNLRMDHRPDVRRGAAVAAGAPARPALSRRCSRSAARRIALLPFSPELDARSASGADPVRRARCCSMPPTTSRCATCSATGSRVAGLAIVAVVHHHRSRSRSSPAGWCPTCRWPVAIALGAIVAPPDAAAATAVMRQIKLPHRIRTILEGESLVNDASALLIYRLAVGAARRRQRHGRHRSSPRRSSSSSAASPSASSCRCCSIRLHRRHRRRADRHHHPVRRHLRRLDARRRRRAVRRADHRRLRHHRRAQRRRVCDARPHPHPDQRGLGRRGLRAQRPRLRADRHAAAADPRAAQRRRLSATSLRRRARCCSPPSSPASPG